MKGMLQLAIFLYLWRVVNKEMEFYCVEDLTAVFLVIRNEKQNYFTTSITLFNF